MKIYFRKENSYLAVLFEIKKIWIEEKAPEFDRIHCDYEKAQQKAFEKVFGGEYIYGCFFHYTKAALMHIRTNLPILFKIYLKEKSEKGDIWKWVSPNKRHY